MGASLKVRVVVVVFVAACTLLSLSLVGPPLLARQLQPDFTVMWAAARASNPYDFREVTRLQSALRQVTDPIPFMYPPSALPIYYPFGLVPFWPAFIVWSLLSITLFWLAARTITKYAALSFLSPHVVLAIGLGQTALLTGAATMWGVSLLRSKPVLAGVSFGLGAALKPQCLFLAPVALISGRHWKALAGMALAWLMFAIATLSFWTDWLHLVPTLPKFLARYYSYLAGYGATPKYFAEFLGLPTLPFQAAGICFGILIVWAAFRSEDSVTRVVALVSGALIASPYALRYELAALAPALVASFMTNTLRGAIVAVPLLCMRVSIIVPALVISSLMALVPSRIGSKLGLPPPVSSGREGQAGA